MFLKKVKETGIATHIIKAVLIILFVVNLIVMIFAAIDRDNSDEAPMGSFRVKDFNTGWTLMHNGEKEDITLPFYADSAPGDELIISNTLPMNLSNGMTLMIRASMEDVVVYVDGRKRDEYSTNSVRDMSFYIPSAYVVTELDEHDCGKPIAIHFTVKTRGSINPITIAHGNNGWYKVIKSGLAVNVIALMVFVCGVLITLAALILGKRYKTDSAGCLGLLVMDVTMWLFSESALRQFIFTRPSLTRIFSYLTLELIAALACMYFDEVQHRVYHKRYLIGEAASALLITVNIILWATGVCELYESLPASHAMAAALSVMIIINIIQDVKSGRIKSYRINMIGALVFIALSLIELARFYFAEFVIFGSYMCIGLIGLMIATVMQTIYDILAEFREHERQRTAMMNKTIETIAGAIDARDEYTGGHSERVGMYAHLLAKEVAAEYELSEEDIIRIHYIGLVHDIGKIGVADSVLNKAGKLTNEEYSLMKRHTEIGYELMSSMGQEIEGILDGIRFHHERYDGKGYPDGLAGEDIPLVARILCIADSYDAMTSNRVYRKRLTGEGVRSELLRCSGSQFDPKLAQAFTALLEHGDLTENTFEGMAVDSHGNVTASARLEARLQSDLLAGAKIIHPSHIRMLCYIIKLMEKKGMSYRVIFAGPSDETIESTELTSYIKKLSNAISSKLDNHDISVRYSDRLSIIALYEKDSSAVDNIINSLTAELPNLTTDQF